MNHVEARTQRGAQWVGQFSVSPWRVQEYLEAVGACGREWAAKHGEQAVPPGFLLYVSTCGVEVAHAEAGITFENGLFGAHRHLIHRPIAVGDDLDVALRVEGPQGPATDAPLELFDLTVEYRGKDGQLAQVETTRLVKFGAGRRPSKEVVTDASPPGDGSGRVQSVDALGLAYMAVALRDPNPVHLSDEFARSLGLPGRILHGTFAIFHAVASVETATGSRVLEYEVRLREPILEDEPFFTQASADADGEGWRHVDVIGAGGRLLASARVLAGPDPASAADVSQWSMQ